MSIDTQLEKVEVPKSIEGKLEGAEAVRFLTYRAERNKWWPVWLLNKAARTVRMREPSLSLYAEFSWRINPSGSAVLTLEEQTFGAVLVDERKMQWGPSTKSNCVTRYCFLDNGQLDRVIQARAEEGPNGELPGWERIEGLVTKFEGEDTEFEEKGILVQSRGLNSPKTREIWAAATGNQENPDSPEVIQTIESQMPPREQVIELINRLKRGQTRVGLAQGIKAGLRERISWDYRVT